MRAALILAVLAATQVAVAAPKKKTDTAAAPTPAAAPAPAPAKPIDPAVQAVLDRIEKDAAGRKAAVDELAKLAPQHIDDLGTFLARPHAASVEDRRNVLTSIKAQVPDKNGRFVTPERKSAKEEKADDDLDWMAELLGLSDEPGLGEVVADDAAIRALAATRDPHAAALIFNAAFGDETMIYRDECGRYLRKMEPYSIPALMTESQSRNYDRKRYATFQLERLDRQEPFKALAAATGDESLTLAILDVFEKTHHREAVHAVWAKTNSDSPRVRAKAREVWLAYVTGPPPPPAPKKKLQLPGGKLTKKEKPLWLTYRELADNELRKAANELLGRDYAIVDPTLDDTDEEYKKKKPEKIDLEAVTKEVFDFYDQQRAKKEGEQWAAAKALADKGDLPGATSAIDRLLAINPERSERQQMAQIYLSYAKQLEMQSKWAEASAAYSKAYGLDSKGADATHVLAAYHYTLGKSLEAQGKDGGPDFRRAIALRPDYAPAKAAAREAAHGKRPTWLLYLAGLLAAAAVALFGLALMKRRTA